MARRRRERDARAALEAARLRADLFPTMPSQPPTPLAPMMGSRLLGFGLVAVGLGFTSLLVFVNAIVGLFR